MDVGRVGAEQSGLTDLLYLFIQAVRVDSDMSGDSGPGLAGELPVSRDTSKSVNSGPGAAKARVNF